jgi:DNA-binding NtrC family response regulator
MNKQKARILVVDDDETIRTMLILILEDEGYFVDAAQNGQEAITKCKYNFYNLAIVDWRLPDIEGTNLLPIFGAITPPMIKVMLTGYPSMQNAIDAVNNGADAFLVKPAEPEQLLTKIKELLKTQERKRKTDEAILAEFVETRIKELLDQTGPVTNDLEQETKAYLTIQANLRRDSKQQEIQPKDKNRENKN